MSSQEHTSTCHTPSNQLQLDLHYNNITHKSVEHLNFLAMSQNIGHLGLLLGNNFYKASTNRYIVLKHLIECLKRKRCLLSCLHLGHSGFTEQHMYHLALLLIHSHSLHQLYLDGNVLSTGFSLFCLGLKMNKCLSVLSLRFLHLSNDDVLLLADALHKHSKLSLLFLAFTNPFRPNIFIQFLGKVFGLSSKSCLSVISVCNYQYNPMKRQLESYKAKQQENGLPQTNLEIFNMECAIAKPLADEDAAAANLHQELLTGK